MTQSDYRLHTSFGSRRLSTTTLSQSTTPYCAASPAEHIRAPSLYGRRSYFIELYQIVSVIQRRVPTVFEETT